MSDFRRWLYIHAFNLVAQLAPADVRAIHLEVFNRGFKAYDEARMVEVPLRAGLRATKAIPDAAIEAAMDSLDDRTRQATSWESITIALEAAAPHLEES